MAARRSALRMVRLAVGKAARDRLWESEVASADDPSGIVLATTK